MAFVYRRTTDKEMHPEWLSIVLVTRAAIFSRFFSLSPPEHRANALLIAEQNGRKGDAMYSYV